MGRDVIQTVVVVDVSESTRADDYRAVLQTQLTGTAMVVLPGRAWSVPWRALVVASGITDSRSDS